MPEVSRGEEGEEFIWAAKILDKHSETESGQGEPSWALLAWQLDWERVSPRYWAEGSFRFEESGIDFEVLQVKFDLDLSGMNS